MSLSARFSQLSSVKAAPVSTGRSVKRNVVAETQKVKRGSVIQKMRGLEGVPQTKPLKLVQTGKANVRINKKGKGKAGVAGKNAAGKLTRELAYKGSVASEKFPVTLS